MLKLSGQGLLALGTFKLGCIMPPGFGPELASISDIGQDMLVFDQDGNRYRILPSSHKIEKLNASGQVIWEAGELGTGAGQFNFPTALEIGTDGSLLVVDTGNNRIEQFDSAGQYIRTIGRGTESGEPASPEHLNMPGAVVLGGAGRVYVCDRRGHQIQVYESSGELYRTFGGQGTELGELNSPTAIELDPAGHLHVIDSGNHRIQVFDTQGTLVRSYGVFGDGAGELRVPQALLIDAAGNSYVADAGDHALDVFDPDGQAVALVELKFDDGRPCCPLHLAWTPDQRIYVAGTPVDLKAIEA
jgi:DNA-binding beta-propeller fold protein YncE